LKQDQQLFESLSGLLYLINEGSSVHYREISRYHSDEQGGLTFFRLSMERATLIQVPDRSPGSYMESILLPTTPFQAKLAHRLKDLS
jgi:hypothetical protein